MSEAAPKTAFEPDLWIHVERILARVPRHIALGACRTDADMIDTLGMNGAFDALRAYKAALDEFLSGTVFQALRAATLEPLSPPELTLHGADPYDDALWARMFDGSWREEPRRRRRARRSRLR